MSDAQAPDAPMADAAPEPAPIPYTRQFVVDASYATRASRAVVTDFLIRRPTMYIGLATLLLGVAVLISRPAEFAWQLFVIIGVIILVVFPLAAFLGTWRAVRKQIPVGSRLRSGFAADRFVIDTPTTTSAVAYTLYRGSRRKGAFVFLRQRSTRRWVALPGELFGDEDLARFPQS